MAYDRILVLVGLQAFPIKSSISYVPSMTHVYIAYIDPRGFRPFTIGLVAGFDTMRTVARHEVACFRVRYADGTRTLIPVSDHAEGRVVVGTQKEVEAALRTLSRKQDRNDRMAEFTQTRLGIYATRDPAFP